MTTKYLESRSVRPQFKRSSKWLCFVVFLLPTAPALGAGYSFAKMADGLTPVGIKFLDFGMSNGTVAFAGPYNAQSVSGVFITTGGPPTAWAKSGDAAPIGTFDSSEFAIQRAAISNGAVAFKGLYGSRTGVFSTSGGPLTTIAKFGDPAPAGTFTGFPDFPDASSGNVAFRGVYTGGEGIFLGAGGGLTTIVKKGDTSPIGTLTSIETPAISGNNVVFSGTAAAASGIFIGDGGALATIVKSGDPAPNGVFTSFRTTSVDGDEVAFLADYTSGRGIFKSTGGVLTTIAKVGDATPFGTLTSLLIEGTPISAGKVAFRGFYSGGNALFIGDGGPLVPLIKDGDSLFGSTVDILTLSRGSFDDDGSGRLAFLYLLANGARGIATATPIPEPSTLMLMLLFFFSIWRRQRHKN
jgi:hypothetical protein